MMSSNVSYTTFDSTMKRRKPSRVGANCAGRRGRGGLSGKAAPPAAAAGSRQAALRRRAPASPGCQRSAQVLLVQGGTCGGPRPCSRASAPSSPGRGPLWAPATWCAASSSSRAAPPGRLQHPYGRDQWSAGPRHGQGRGARATWAAASGSASADAPPPTASPVRSLPKVVDSAAAAQIASRRGAAARTRGRGRAAATEGRC